MEHLAVADRPIVKQEKMKEVETGDRTSLVREVHRILFRRFLSGEFKNSNLNPECKYEDVRKEVLKNRGLLIELAPFLERIFQLTQEESARNIGPERFPGERMKLEVLVQEMFNHSESIGKKSNYVSSSFENATKESRPVIVVLDNQAQRGKVSTKPNDAAHDKISFSLLLKNRDLVKAIILESAFRRQSVEHGSNIRNELLRSISKKIGHSKQAEKGTPFDSRLSSWIELYRELTEPNDGFADLTVKRSRRAYQESKYVIMDLLLQRLIRSIVDQPYLTIVRIGGNHGIRVQLINTLGQGVDTLGIFLNPEYVKNPSDDKLSGLEFLGLVDTGNFVSVTEKLKAMIEHPSRPPEYFTRLVTLLIRSGFIFPKTTNHPFTDFIVRNIIQSTRNKPFFDRVWGCLVTNGLVRSNGLKDL